MTAEQKKMIRDNAQATIDLAEARLRDDRVTDENVRHDLEQIATLARALLAMVGEPSSPWSTKVCSCGRLTAEAPNPHARAIHEAQTPEQRTERQRKAAETTKRRKVGGA